MPEATRERNTNKTQKVSRRKEIIKTRAEINEIEKTIEKINETKTWFFENINRVDKHLTRLIKNKREKALINKIRNGKEVTRDKQKYTGS